MTGVDSKETDWIAIGKETFVQTLSRIHPDHVRDIWADHESVVKGMRAPVVPELVDYYCDLVDPQNARRYAYLPTRFDLSEYSEDAAMQRKVRNPNTKGGSVVPGRGSCGARFRGVAGRGSDGKPQFYGAYLRLPSWSRVREEYPSCY